MRIFRHLDCSGWFAVSVSARLTLAEAATAVPGAVLVGNGSTPFRDIVFDSRQVAPGDLFIAIPRVSADGERYVSDALLRGAAGIVADRKGDLPSNTNGLLVSSTRVALAMLSAWQFGWPGRQLRVVGVTGTDGKTTTTNL
ncbi:MAG TPA: Mur ligase domain-containing protein, partial [Chloroflexota bacterium]|nr:Mur ligase domain-containing protein [Chloroflexota bacterium]